MFPSARKTTNSNDNYKYGMFVKYVKFLQAASVFNFKTAKQQMYLHIIYQNDIRFTIWGFNTLLKAVKSSIRLITFE